MYNLKIERVERTWVSVPLKERPARALIPEHWRWTVFELLRLHTNSELVGYGETMIYYTWGRVPEEQANRVIGHSPFEFLWDDTLGAGLQMAIWDLAGKAAGVPCHQLLGPLVRDACPISWWSNDMPLDDWRGEIQEAISLGYRNAKLKARPWRDHLAFMRALDKEVPAGFEFDADFNSFLRDTATAVPYLTELAQIPTVHLFETPIPQSDVQGNALLRQQVNRPIAHHYGEPPTQTAMREGVCDGFVIGGGALRIRQQAELAAQFNKPFFLQLVGTGLTTAFMLQFGAVLTHATWPAITCWETYTDDLIRERFPIENGFARVPEAPGLGIEVDEEAIARYRVEPGYDPPMPKLIYLVLWPNGARAAYMPGWGGCWKDFAAGNQPLFAPGVQVQVWRKDGGREWAALWERVQQGAVRSVGGGL